MPLITLFTTQTEPVDPTASRAREASMAVGSFPANGVIFLDETGVNPLPPGIVVSVYLAGDPQDAAHLIYSGYTQIGGKIAFNPRAAIQYVAVFYGTLGPKTTQNFVGESRGGQVTTVFVDAYRSPFMSTSGYRDGVLSLLPKNRAGQAARAPGGVVYAMASGLGAVLAALDLNQQQILASERLPTCAGGDIDSWAFDFFGSYLLRYLGEDDPTYYSRVLAGLGPRCTLAAIEQVVNQFYVATAAVRAIEQDENIAYDTTGGYDESGAYDVVASIPSLEELIPAVKVWDAQSNPTLAAVYGIAPPYFVINIGFSGVPAWFLDHSHLDIETYLIDGNAVQTSSTPPDARLGALVNLVKAAGAKPLYQTYAS